MHGIGRYGRRTGNVIRDVEHDEWNNDHHNDERREA